MEDKIQELVTVCLECGGTDIEVKAWVKINDNNRYVEDADPADCFCVNCQEIVGVDEA